MERCHYTPACNIAKCWQISIILSARLSNKSCVCAIVKYAVLEANGKANGIGEMVWPTLESRTAKEQNRTEQNTSQTLGPIWMPFQIYHYRPPRESICRIWLTSIQPLPLCACVKKARVRVGFYGRPRNRAGHYIFAVWFLSFFFLLFPRQISAVTDWMSTILLHMVWP